MPRNTANPRAGLRRRATILLALAAAPASISAHSWIESAVKVLPNGSFTGPEGFPRGYVPRGTPEFSDLHAQHLIPDGGVYNGNEVLNKFPLDVNSPHPMLSARPGDKVAILHLENGHVSLPQAQANKPLNRGNVYLYGTSQPKEHEKLFDVHLVWNREGTGGDGRGRLLATRNYDDGQCYQDNHQAIAQERVAKLAADGAKIEKELKCQSIITIPSDAKPNSIYTVYWYWDWPTLNPDKIDMEATKAGQYPWTGSFMRGDKMPEGWKQDQIFINESYSSTIDIKIVDELPGVVAYEKGTEPQPGLGGIYAKGIKEQIDKDFDIQVPNIGGAALSPGGPKTAVAPQATPTPSTATADGSPAIASDTSGSGACAPDVVVTATVTNNAAPSKTDGSCAADETVTVTVTATAAPDSDKTSQVQKINPETVTKTVSVSALPTTVQQTVYVTTKPNGTQTAPSQLEPSTTMLTLTTRIAAKPTATTTPAAEPSAPQASKRHVRDFARR
ncbi:hypothetical protein CDD81_4401 [Ophiocordyceps australis]|uniref:DUF7492 domain-containing protein n=1 Tax=Ophiocordyceps australis TaxID=1399860 RepID=A0A2C5YH21_9HYPO|nr:hypothetical protein CDD81_4401 [Ophiocordyceps australis]